MKREIEQHPAVVEPVAVDSLGNVRSWLQEQAGKHNLKWLLAHADDGVIWGRLNARQLVTSDSVAPEVSPPLRAETLQQARLFAEHAELLLWRDGDNQLHACLIRDAAEDETPTFTDAIDEAQLLWGTHGEHRNNFTLLRDGTQGLRHAVPIPLPLGKNNETDPPRLWVRHYLEDDDNGFTRIVASRLFDLRLEGAK